jgi:hypothetical protein
MWRQRVVQKWICNCKYTIFITNLTKVATVFYATIILSSGIIFKNFAFFANDKIQQTSCTNSK